MQPVLKGFKLEPEVQKQPTVKEEVKHEPVVQKKPTVKEEVKHEEPVQKQPTVKKQDTKVEYETFEDKDVKDQKPLAYVDVDIGNGQTKKIGIFEMSKAAKIARKFAKKH